MGAVAVVEGGEFSLVTLVIEAAMRFSVESLESSGCRI